MFAPRHPVAKRPLLLLLFAVMAAACYGSPGAEPASVEPAPSVSAPSSGRPVGETAGPITYPPDNMWAFLATMPGLQRTSDTLAGAVDFAEAVVVGRYLGVERGARYGVDWTAVALIDVDAVVKGTPNLGPDGLLRVEFVLVVGSGSYPEKEFADLERSIPKDPALLYLISWASFMDAWGEVPGWSTRVDLADRYRTIGGDGAMRVVNGRIEPPPYIDGWPMELRGLGIEQVKDQIRAAIRPGGPPGSPAP
ncbi:MAG: hypothetical protein HW391_1831 [Chloroflexi bacterium]|nr:hypothetical protein [Chloroflexota bacterium]